jgi:hypothetical protein
MRAWCKPACVLLGLAACGSPPAPPWFGEGVSELELRLAPEALAELKKRPKEWVEGSLSFEGRTYERIAVRLKGHRSKQSLEKKPAFKLHFTKLVPGRRIFGLEGLTLNNMVEDPSMLRETLAYRMHRALGVPAPRTGYAVLKLNGEHRGLHLLLEPIDDTFVGKKGSVYEGEYGCDLYPEDVDGFDRDAGSGSRKELVRLTEVARGPARELFHLPDSPIDRDRVLSYLAVSAVIGDFDGYRQGHNYYLRHDRKRKKWSLIPWGLDRTFQTHLGIYDSGGLLAKKCFADGLCRTLYLEKVRAAVEGLEALERSGIAARLRSSIDHALKTDPKKPHAMMEVLQSHRALERFLRERPEKVKKQIGAEPKEEQIECEPLVSGFAEFLLCNAPMSWEEASAFCASRGRTLASIESEQQSRALYRRTQKLRKTRWWIGFNDRRLEDDFRWSDGSTVLFAWWGKGEPDNYVCNQDCVAIVDGKEGRWHDNHCAQRFPFICR